MRFVLVSVEGDNCVLKTRTTGKIFKTKVSDLIFIETNHNYKKAIKLSKNNHHEK